MIWNQIIAIALNEMRLIVREKTLLMLLFVFLLMTFFSAYIGWSTNTIVLQVYHAAIVFLRQSGATHIPPNPFIQIPPLAMFKNMIIYVFLIGALLAIVVGHQSFIRERKSGVVLLLFSKPLSKNSYILGKVFGILFSLVLLLGITYVVSILATLFIPHNMLSVLEIEKLFLFYCFSLVYMLIFSFIGLFFAIILPDESLALFAPVLVWVAVTFIFPEVITGQNPVALLNPTNISQTASQGTFFTAMHTVLSPVSIEQHYTGVTQPLLETQQQFQGITPVEVLSENTQLAVSLSFYLFVSLSICIYALRMYAVTKDHMYE